MTYKGDIGGGERNVRCLKAWVRRSDIALIIYVSYIAQAIYPDFLIKIIRRHDIGCVERTFGWMTIWRRLVRDYESSSTCYRP